jgi:uncharacterized membrane protein YfcA
LGSPMAHRGMALATLLSILTGLSLGLLGGGGSILIVPVLIHVLGLPTRPAITVSLLVVSLASLSAMAVHARARLVRYRVAAMFGASSAGGALLGSTVSRFLPDQALLVTFTAVMLVTGAAMLGKRATARAIRCASLRCTSALGLGVGALTGVVGAGGGFIVVPALATLGGLAMPQAIATSLLVIGVNSLVGFLVQFAHVAIDARVAIVVAAAVVGSYAGAHLAHRVRPEALRRGFAVLVLATGAVMAFGQIRELILGAGGSAGSIAHRAT